MVPRVRSTSTRRTSLLLNASIRAMSQPTPKPFASDSKIEDFQRHLESSDRILALLGAGLSAASGLPTFRGAGGMWKSHQATSLATPQAFRHDPGLVWQFYSYRRHMALQAKPNLAHYALAELARKKPNFVTLSQNVDGRSCFYLCQMIIYERVLCTFCLSYPYSRRLSITKDPGPVQ
jgi:hypothetical protein